MSNQESDYKKIRAIWYKKLYKAGFRDIEQDEDNLKEWSTKFTRKKSMVTWKDKADYYDMATRFLNEYKFKKNLEKVIWEYHINAMSVRDIAKTLKKAKVIDRTGAWVHIIIQRLQEEMKKMYVVGYND